MPKRFLLSALMVLALSGPIAADPAFWSQE
jgi:hypothetical protein